MESSQSSKDPLSANDTGENGNGSASNTTRNTTPYPLSTNDTGESSSGSASSITRNTTPYPLSANDTGESSSGSASSITRNTTPYPLSTNDTGESSSGSASSITRNTTPYPLSANDTGESSSGSASSITRNTTPYPLSTNDTGESSSGSASSITRNTTPYPLSANDTGESSSGSASSITRDTTPTEQPAITNESVTTAEMNEYGTKDFDTSGNLNTPKKASQPEASAADNVNMRADPIPANDGLTGQISCLILQQNDLQNVIFTEEYLHQKEVIRNIDVPQMDNNFSLDSDPLSLNHIQPFNVNLPLGDTTRSSSYLYSSQPEVFEQMVMDAQDVQNLDIPSNLMKNRDVDSLVAAHLMTSLARGDLSFDQHNVQTYPQSDQPSFQDLDRSYSQEQNGGYPIPDQNNNMYGNDFNITEIHNSNNGMSSQSSSVMNSYLGQGLGDGRSTDPVYNPRRHSYPSGNIGQSEGHDYSDGNRFHDHQRTRSEPSESFGSMSSSFGQMLQSQPMNHENQNLIHPQACYPQGNLQIQQYHSDSVGFYNEQFLPIQNQNGHLLGCGDQEPGVIRQTKAKRQLIDAESNTDAVLILSDESDSLSPGRVNEISKCSLDDEFDDDADMMPSLPKQHRKSINRKGQDNIMDRLYFSSEGLTREKPRRKVCRRKRRHVSQVPSSFFTFLAPDMDTKDVDSIDHRNLIAKYIDYLLLENEHITEMSKSVSVTIENCVMDDPYLMDIIKVKIPFPTPKYLQWLKVYYPKIQVDWEAVNHELSTYIPDAKGQKKRTYYLDSRPFPVLLGESFYFFQREKDRMSVKPMNM